MTKISYRLFHELVQKQAHEGFVDRSKRELPGDRVRDWLEAESQVFRDTDYHVIITVGICSCSDMRLAGCFEANALYLRGIRSVFSEVNVDRHNQGRDKITQGCQAFIDTHRTIYADLMFPLRTKNGKVATDGTVLVGRVYDGLTSREQISSFFLESLTSMVEGLRPGLFQDWLWIEPTRV